MQENEKYHSQLWLPVLSTFTWNSSFPTTLNALQMYTPKSVSFFGITKMLPDLLNSPLISFDHVISGSGFPSASQVSVELWWSHESTFFSRPVLFILGLSVELKQLKQSQSSVHATLSKANRFADRQLCNKGLTEFRCFLILSFSP